MFLPSLQYPWVADECGRPAWTRHGPPRDRWLGPGDSRPRPGRIRRDAPVCEEQ